ncbi:MAG: hypothetical protein J0L84_08650 [Verrucomicrobia bacterium]|nr:hypothetical protein [Verrucomicrobiota bacterium]
MLQDLRLACLQLLRDPGCTAAAIALLITAPIRGNACTIFVLTDADRTLFFNNGDWFNPATRLWFVPAGKDHLGCAYLGFDNGWAQGGLNTAGLAFDWVSGFEEKYEPGRDLQSVRGNPSERMLESCTTVEEAVAFYRRYREPDFARSRILIADRTGASVVIGASGEQLQVASLRQSRGFGWGRAALERELAKSPAPTVANGAAILRACRQAGDGGTKYSNVFDLRSGGMVLFPIPGRDESVALTLAAELAKGPHYYDITGLPGQLAAPPQPLHHNMKRFYLDEFAPLPDQETAVTERVRALIRDSANGTMRSEDYAPEFWLVLSPQQKKVQAELKSLGGLVALTLVGRHDRGSDRWYRFRVEFDRITVLQRFAFDGQDRVESVQSEASELKPGARLRADPP